MATIYSNLKSGQISDNPLSSGATTINSSAFADLPAVTGSDILWITLDPDAANGAPEIVKVTAHTASATSVTVTRAQQSTSARSHPVNTVWKHVVTKTDLDAFIAEIADGSITTAKLAADAVDGTKIADDSIDSEHYVDGSIDTAHIANSAVTEGKIDLTWATDWTPTFQTNADGDTAASVVNGTWDAKYLRLGDVGWISATFTAGSSDTLNGRSLAIDLPSGWTAASSGLGQFSFRISGTTYGQRKLLSVGTAPGYNAVAGSTTRLDVWNELSGTAGSVNDCTTFVIAAPAGAKLVYDIGPIPLA